MPDALIALHHVSVLVADLDRSLRFYRDILGLEVDPSRPLMGYEGAWLKVNGHQQVHLLKLPNPDPVTQRPAHVGRDRHAAFTVRDLSALQAELDSAGVPFTRSASGRAALFCRDPDGNGIELVQA